MPEIYIPKSTEEKDIYDYGYNKQLYKPSEDISNEIFYNQTTEPINPSNILTGELSSTVRGVVKDEIILGDGSDGDVVISANTTLTSDKYYNNLFISSGVVLSTGGYKIFAKNKSENNGIIRRNGNNASGSTQGAALSNISLGGSAAGGVGEVPPTAGGAGTGANPGLGGNGGAGGASTGGGDGSAGGSTTASITGYRTLNDIIQIWDNNTSQLIKGGSGGGGGGGVGSQSGGGGGSGGGITLVGAKMLINNGTIEVLGGNGSDGTISGADRSGGGGGGGGGFIGLIYARFINSGTISILGGQGGLAGGAGAVAGTNGSAGKYFEFSLL